MIPEAEIISIKSSGFNMYAIVYTKNGKRKTASISVFELSPDDCRKVEDFLKSHPKYINVRSHTIGSRRFNLFVARLKDSRLGQWAKVLYEPNSAFKESLRISMGSLLLRFATELFIFGVLTIVANVLVCSSCFFTAELILGPIEGDVTGPWDFVEAYTMTSLAAVVVVFILIFIGGGLLHLAIHLFGAKGNYTTTLRISVMSATPFLLLAWIPCIGFYSGIWTLILLAIGVKELHGLSMGKAFLSVFLSLLPWVVIGVMLWVFA